MVTSIMPIYDFRCKNCEKNISLTYKTYQAYHESTHQCPHCHGIDLTRIILKINISRRPGSHDYTKMESDEMLSVFESGDSQAVGEMMKQVGEQTPDLDNEYKDVADQLSRGRSFEAIEKQLQDKTLDKSSDSISSSPIDED